MKYLEKFQLIKLDDDKKYIVTNSVIYDNDNYALLINAEDIKDHILALVSKNDNDLEINPIDLKNESNKEFIFRLINLFEKDMNEDFRVKNDD